MSRNVELESAIKYTISNPTRYNGFLRVAANNFRLSTANQLFVYYQKEDADIVLDAGRWEKLFGRIVADNAQKIRIVQTGKTGKPQWTTYYDIADTIVTDDSKPVMRATVAQDVSMEQIREIAEKKMLLASSQIEDYMAANGIIAPAERIIGFIKDSIISEVAIKCGQEPLLYYEQINDFRKWALKDERIFKLIALGIPEKEIAFIHDAKNAKQKEKMFERVNNGEIRVIMGSTSKMGAGTNIQKKLYALFHLDCPWRPSDLEQQEGRIERQGNGNDTVKIFTCITEGTFDGYMYQLIEAKQRVAAQIMTSKSPAREVEEDDVMTLNYAELKALTMENPVFKEKMDLEIAISRLKMQKSNYLSNKYRMEDKLAKEFPRLISETKTGIENLTKDAATYVKNERAEFTITINGVVYTDRVEGGKAMTAYAGRMLGRKIGEYHGFDLYAGMKAEWLQVMVKGATAYWFELGPDAGGNIQRLNNLIKSYPERLLTAKKDLENLYAEQKTVSETVKKPFFHETELKQKLARLAEIDNQIAQSEKEKSEDTAKGVINDEQEKKFGVEDYCREYATGEIAPEYEAESSM